MILGGGGGGIKLGCLFSVKLDFIRTLDKTIGNNITYPVLFKSVQKTPFLAPDLGRWLM